MCSPCGIPVGGVSVRCSWRCWSVTHLFLEVKGYVSSQHRGDPSLPSAQPRTAYLATGEMSLSCGRSARDERVQVFLIRLQGNADVRSGSLSHTQDYCYRHEPHPKGNGGGVATIYSNIFSNSQK